MTVPTTQRCERREVTDKVLWAVDDPGVGYFVGARLNSSGLVLGSAEVSAYLPAEQLTATAELLIRARYDINLFPLGYRVEPENKNKGH